MAMPKIEIAPALIAEGRRLYEETDTPVHVIATRMGLKRSTLNYRIVEWNWNRRRYSSAGVLPPTAVAAVPAPAAAEAEPSEPAPTEPPPAFAARLQRVIDGEMAVIERTLKVLGPASSAEAERTTRILATISRTVQEIVATAQGQTRADDTDSDPVPSDIDAFRESLAQRIEAFVAAERAAADGQVPDDESLSGGQ